MSAKCPSCFSILPPEPLELLCTGTCVPKHDEQASAFLGYGVAVRPVYPISRGTPQGVAPRLTCTACSIQTTTEACPSCRYGIPALWRNALVTCIAMAGARATGKSLMIASSKMQLDLLAELRWGSPVEPLGDTEERFRRHYLEPLLEQRRLMPPTQGIGRDESITRDPMMFRFTEKGPPGSRVRVLVLRDVAGEDLEKDVTDTRPFGFFSRADAVLVMVDPLAVSEIRNKLEDVVPPQELRGADALGVLHHVLGHMTGNVPGADTHVPVALVLSKFDVIQKLRSVEGTKWASVMSRAGSTLQRDPSLATPQYDREDGDLLHEEVRSLLDMLGSSSLASTLEAKATTYRYFVASALGESPDGDIVNKGGIAPFRVLDPIKWALSLA